MNFSKYSTGVKTKQNEEFSIVNCRFALLSNCLTSNGRENRLVRWESVTPLLKQSDDWFQSYRSSFPSSISLYLIRSPRKFFSIVHFSDVNINKILEKFNTANNKKKRNNWKFFSFLLYINEKKEREKRHVGNDFLRYLSFFVEAITDHLHRDWFSSKTSTMFVSMLQQVEEQSNENLEDLNTYSIFVWRVLCEKNLQDCLTSMMNSSCLILESFENRSLYRDNHLDHHEIDDNMRHKYIRSWNNRREMR